jgi:site-specific recombinase XerD
MKSRQDIIKWTRNHGVKATQSSYNTYGNQFKDFCEQHGVQSTPATEETTASFLIHLFDKNKARSTINNSAYSSVVDLHKFHEFGSDHLTTSKLLKSTKSSIARHTKAPKRKKPCTKENLLSIASLVDFTKLKHLRDYLMILLAYKGFLRQSNLSLLLWDDVWIEVIQVGSSYETVLFILLQTSKTDQIREGHTIVIGMDTSNPWKCPILVIRQYYMEVHRQNLAPGHLFFNLSSRKCKGLAPNFFNKYVVKPWCKLAHIDGITSHCFRAGGVTDAIAAGIKIHVAARHGNWKSNAIFRYINDSLATQLSVTKLI